MDMKRNIQCLILIQLTAKFLQLVILVISNSISEFPPPLKTYENYQVQKIHLSFSVTLSWKNANEPLDQPNICLFLIHVMEGEDRKTQGVIKLTVLSWQLHKLLEAT